MDPIIDLLQLGLDGATLRQKALSNNIANVDTPEYKRKDVDFMTTLNRVARRNKFMSSGSTEAGPSLQLSTTSENHLTAATSGFSGNSNNPIPGSNPVNNGNSTSRTPFKVITMNGTSTRNDGNNVDIDVEMAELAKNEIYYNVLVQQLNARLANMKDVINKAFK